jgi:hypothetical protein
VDYLDQFEKSKNYKTQKERYLSDQEGAKEVEKNLKRRPA